MKQNSLLIVKNVSKSYGEKKVLDSIDFTLNKGEVVALLGHNGSGKTTIVKTICGLVLPDNDDARIILNGEPINHSVYGRLGAVLEGARNCHWKLTPGENARYFATIKKKFTHETRERIDSYTELLGLREYCDMPVSQLSAGNKQKVSLLCALAADADMLLLDEPTLGLDIEAVDSLKKSIRELASQQNKGILITSHDFNFIEDICNRALILRDSKIIYDGDLNEFRSRIFKYEMTIKFDKENSSNYEEITRSYFAKEEFDLELEGQCITIRLKNLDQALRFISDQYTAGVQFKDFSITPVSLEKAFKAVRGS